METLENKLVTEESQLDEGLVEKSSNLIKSLKDYAVDTSAGWTFYTPLMAGVEYIAGAESGEILKSRLCNLLVHAAVMRPVGKMRKYWAKRWNVTDDSLEYKKWLVDLSSAMMFQAPLYFAVLSYTIAKNPSETIGVALPLGVAVVASTTRYFGKWQDYWRRLWGTEPVFNK